MNTEIVASNTEPVTRRPLAEEQYAGFVDAAMIGNNTLFFDKSLRDDPKRRAQHEEEYGGKCRNAMLGLLQTVSTQRGTRLPAQINCGTSPSYDPLHQERHDLYLDSQTGTLHIVPIEHRKADNEDRYYPLFDKATPAPIGEWIHALGGAFFLRGQGSKR